MPTDAHLLRLRGLRTSDEFVFAAAHEQLRSEGHEFGYGYQDGMPWDDYLKRVSDSAIGVNMADGIVASTSLIADVDGELVGRTSIRHELNEFLLNYGGHIGYAVVPEQRRKGYATEILRQSLKFVHAMGINRVLVTCNDNNIGSIKTIEACGGQLENVVSLPPRNTARRRYWI